MVSGVGGGNGKETRMRREWIGRRKPKIGRTCATEPSSKADRCSFCGRGKMASASFSVASLDREGVICVRCIDKFFFMSKLAGLSGLHEATQERWKEVEDRIRATMARDSAPPALKRAVTALVLALCNRAAKLLVGDREGPPSRFALACRLPGAAELVTAVTMAMGMCAVGPGHPFSDLSSLCAEDPLMIEIGVIVADGLVPDQGQACAVVSVCAEAKDAPHGSRVFEVAAGEPEDN